MKISNINLAITFLLFSLAIPISWAAEEQAKCYGVSTLLYSNSNMDLIICHGEYTKINVSKLDQWQDCADAIIQVRNKKQNIVYQYADCSPTGSKQFSVHGGLFKLRHYYTEYPGFKERPLLIETLDLATSVKQYEFIKKFPVCSKKNIDDAIAQINLTVAKPSDMRTYFDSVYGGFYKLRDCANDYPSVVLETLKKYGNDGIFDGEVAETLDAVTGEVELISAALTRNKMK